MEIDQAKVLEHALIAAQIRACAPESNLGPAEAAAAVVAGYNAAKKLLREAAVESDEVPASHAVQIAA